MFYVKYVLKFKCPALAS